jgi:transcriptional regulator with XRE-family HTH domain
MTPSAASGRVLVPLPPSVWDSWEVERAVAESSPGAVIAIARRAYGLRQDELGAIAGFSQSAISRLESGGNLAFDTRVLRIFQSLLGIPAHLVGLADPDAVASAPKPVRALTGLETDVLLMLCAPAAVNAAQLGVHADRGSRSLIDEDVVYQLLIARRKINDLDDWIVSSELLPAVRRLYEFVDQLRPLATGVWRGRMLNVAALYAEFCGWLHLEAGDLIGANAWTTRALQQAQGAEDRDLVAYAYRRMSQLAQLEGDEERAVGLARAATREVGVGPQVRAMALQQEARAYARIGDERESLTRLDEAYELVQGIRPQLREEYRLASWFSVHQVEMERVACCVELGRLDEALALHERGMPGWSPHCRWGLGVHLGKVAIAHAKLGDLEQAAAAGTQALALARGTGCLLIATELRRLRRWASTPAIAGIVEALGSAV